MVDVWCSVVCVAVLEAGRVGGLLGVGVSLGVGVREGVKVFVGVRDGVGVKVRVGVFDGVRVNVGVGVRDGVNVFDAVTVRDGGYVIEGGWVRVGVLDGVGVKIDSDVLSPHVLSKVRSTSMSPTRGPPRPLKWIHTCPVAPPAKGMLAVSEVGGEGSATRKR